jgi:hypothetical protein
MDALNRMLQLLSIELEDAVELAAVWAIRDLVELYNKEW